MLIDKPWKKIYEDTNMVNHDFNLNPYIITADEIKKECSRFKKTTEREVRILCKQDTREARPNIFKEKGLFILPKKNGIYYIIKGEGYVDIPEINSPIQEYNSKLDFDLQSSKIGNSEMQYLDFAYANSLIRSFMNDNSLVLTIRGRKYTPSFSFKVGNNNLEVESVQTEVDAGYEGRDSIVLVEAKNTKATNTIIRQLYYPYRQWKINTTKKVYTLFFERKIVNNEILYYIWQYEFTEVNNYNSIHLLKSCRYRINEYRI